MKPVLSFNISRETREKRSKYCIKWKKIFYYTRKLCNSLMFRITVLYNNYANSALMNGSCAYQRATLIKLM